MGGKTRKRNKMYTQPIAVRWEDMGMQLVAVYLWRSAHVHVHRGRTYLSIGKPITHGCQQLSQTARDMGYIHVIMYYTH